MSITRAAIEKNRVTAAVLLVLLLGGYIAYKNLPRAEDPGFIIRAAVVTTRFPGASPERVELLVTDPLEKAIQEIPELDNIQSTSRTGISIITVNILERYKNMRPIWDTLRRKVERETPKLPEGVEKPEVNDEYGDVFGIVLSLTGDGYSYAEMKEIADDIRDGLLRLPDAAKVDIYGAQEERIFIDYNTAKLAELGLSPIQLQNLLHAQNIVLSGGSALVGKERLAIEPSGNFESVDDISKTIVKLPRSDELVRLGDLVDVYRGYIDPPKQKVHSAIGAKLRSSGRRFAAECALDRDCGAGLCSKKGSQVGRCIPRHTALVLAVSMRDGGKITDLGKQVEDKIAEINRGYPLGLEVEKVNFQPHDVQEVVDNFVSNLLQAIAVVMTVMILFLGFRTGLVVSSLIPAAMMCSLLVMSIGGVGLDQVSLAALIIALGMLVDNAVVMAESTMVQMAAGKPGKQAAIDSARELAIPLLVSSLTTSAAFLPIYLAKAAVGEYTRALFIVVTIALLSSWLLSLTLVPLLCYLALKVKPSGDSAGTYDSRLYRGYRVLLLLFVRRPGVTMLLVALAFAAGMVGFAYVPKLFFPASDRPSFTVEVDLKAGTAIEDTTRTVQRVESFVRDELMRDAKRPEGITTWGTFIGNGGPRFYLGHNAEESDPSYAFMLFSATSYEAAQNAMDRIRTFLQQKLPEVNANVRPRQSGPPVRYPVQIRLQGKEIGPLFHIVDQLKAKLRSTAKVININDDWGLRTKKIVVHVNQARARRAGISSQDVAISLKSISTGLKVSEYREDDKVIPVEMRSELADRRDIGKLELMRVLSQSSGKSVPLKQIADAEIAWEPSKRKRYNGDKVVTVQTDLETGGLASAVNAELIPWLEQQKRGWPAGYGFTIAGEAENSEKANQAIAEQLPIAGFIILLLLVGQFNSFRRPLIILVTLPLGLIGVVIGLFLGKSYFGFMTLLGVISLFGIVINNAIVLIDRIRIEIDENGLEPPQAIITAAQRRLRPILLTTITTICGLVPLWVGGSPMWWPMAIAIIFGLGFATVLTLGVVPALYAILFRVSFKGYGR